MDIPLLSQLGSMTSQRGAKKPTSEGDFAALLKAAELGDSVAMLTIEEIKALLEDPNSSLPETLRKSLSALFLDTVMAPKELRVLSKQLAVYASGLADVVNFSSNPTEVAQADLDLQVITSGMIEMVDYYGQSHALNDLIGIWKKLDTRSASFERLEETLTVFAKTGTLDLGGRPDLEKSEDKQQVTFDLQYAMWTKLAAYGNLERSKNLLATFEESQQMRTAKLEFKGEPLDSLIEAEPIAFEN
jgi:hypothetical protein